MARRSVGAGTLFLDSDGVTKLAAGDPLVRARQRIAIARGAQVAISSITLTEVLRGGPRDAPVHQVLSRVSTLPVTAEIGRAAGELLGTTRLSGNRCAIDAVVAATALVMPRPVVLLTSDPDDLGRLVEEPDCPKERRVAVLKV